MKIAVCVPHTGTLKAHTARCLSEMVLHTATTPINYNGQSEKPEFRHMFLDLGPLQVKRTRLAVDALAWGADYILWIDSDQIFPSDGLLRLMMRDKPIVAGNYANRHGLPVIPVARDLNGQLLQRATGIEEAGSVGFGFCLMKGPALAKVPQPWFAVQADGKDALGEDFHFCNMARQAGVPIYVDHDLEIGHLAEVVLTLNGGTNDLSSTSTPAGDRQGR